MDFKVCGTRDGITALQMDIKIAGLTRKILERGARPGQAMVALHILEQDGRGDLAAREEVSVYAPRITTIKIKPDKMRDIIGPGGKVIKDDRGRTPASQDRHRRRRHGEHRVVRDQGGRAGAWR